MNHNITWDWLAGLLETDGSILLFIDKSSKSFKFEFRLSNADINQNVIKEVQDFYLKFGINSTIDIGENAGDESKKLNNRASSLRIQGANQVQKFITLLRANVTNSFVFISTKYRDLLIMEKTLELDRSLNVAEKLDLKKSMHKSNKDETDLDFGNTKSRLQWETELGVLPNKSQNAAKLILENIDEEYQSHQSRIQKEKLAGTLKINKDFVSGLIDGDGCYYVTNSFKGVGQVEWQGVFTYVMHKREQLTVEVLIYAFGFKNLTYNSPSNKLQFKIKVRKQDEVKKCLEFHQKYPLRTEYRNLELANIRELFRIRDNDEIYNIAQIEPLLIEIYRVSKIYQKAPPKNPPTIEEAIPLLRNWVSKCKKAKKFKEEVEAYLNPKK